MEGEDAAEGESGESFPLFNFVMSVLVFLVTNENLSSVEYTVGGGEAGGREEEEIKEEQNEEEENEDEEKDDKEGEEEEEEKEEEDELKMEQDADGSGDVFFHSCRIKK